MTNNNIKRTNRGENHSIIGTEVLVTETFIGVCREKGVGATNTEIHATNPKEEGPLAEELA